jgi:hypothetical protein
MKISDICEMLKNELYDNGYEYGFLLNGERCTPDMSGGFDENYYRLSLTEYVVQSPEDTMKDKIGTCVDAVMVMKKLLLEKDISSKIWLLHHKAKNKVHTILTFAAEGKTVYLELTPQSAKPWYGKEIIYDSEAALIEEYEANGYDITEVTGRVKVGEQPHFLLEALAKS